MMIWRSIFIISTECCGNQDQGFTPLLSSTEFLSIRKGFLVLSEIIHQHIDTQEIIPIIPDNFSVSLISNSVVFKAGLNAGYHVRS